MVGRPKWAASSAKCGRRAAAPPGAAGRDGGRPGRVAAGYPILTARDRAGYPASRGTDRPGRAPRRPPAPVPASPPPGRRPPPEGRHRGPDPTRRSGEIAKSLHQFFACNPSHHSLSLPDDRVKSPCKMITLWHCAPILGWTVGGRCVERPGTWPAAWPRCPWEGASSTKIGSPPRPGARIVTAGWAPPRRSGRESAGGGPAGASRCPEAGGSPTVGNARRDAAGELRVRIVQLFDLSITESIESGPTAVLRGGRGCRDLDRHLL